MHKITFHRFAISALCCASTTVLLACGGGGGVGDPAADASTTQTLASTAQVQAAAKANANAPSADGGGAAATDAATGTAPASSTTTSTSTSTSTSTIPEAVPAPAPAAETKTPFGQDAAAYSLSFSEEFDSFNSSLWNDHMWYDSSNATKNFAVEDGKLKIWPQRDGNGNFFNRTVDTDGKYYQTYGYFEIEAKLPKGKGTWPAFWLFNHIDSRRPEMDVMEAYAGGAAPWGFTDSSGVSHPQAYAPTVWKGDQEGQLVGSRQFDTGTDLSAGFHKYAVKWEPNKQTYYFDGKEVLTLNVTMGDPMYIMLDLWFGSASGSPDNSTPQGKTNSYEVNYVRAWKFK
ncbi:glycoside hydrolase family 16 protein [Noviherbaspirillum sp.]|uniref:glycoside hydrolase family 16 protein n=1 Tax=Noviherbaspirillum sp. TaxID=1926288 RepID=UPI0025F8275B|nr:glycoside hydrolase family 16 protein [Noviherbaspirillum sp.]